MAKKRPNAKKAKPAKPPKKSPPEAQTVEAKAEKKKQIEQYAHSDKLRVNNPPVGLVTPATDPLEPPKRRYEYDPHLDPQLVWAGKAERTSFEIPTVSLHVHERIDPKRIIAAVRTNGERAKPGKTPTARQRSLFEEPAQNPPLRDALDFYKHPHGWSNRLIAGDSLLVMNSLLEKEGMASKVQMVYFDPPYGISYKSNFQPFIQNRDVKDTDHDLTQEPEMIRAFRDIWELGIHSYLSALRDRLRLARELLTESGSCFLQISTENLHRARALMDEVFGSTNCVEVIAFRKKTMPLGGRLLEGICDYLVWYARDKEKIRYRSLFQDMEIQGDAHWNIAIEPNRDPRTMTRDEVNDHARFPSGTDFGQLIGLYPTGTFATGMYTLDFKGKQYTPPPGRCWKTPIEGMKRLALAGRLVPYSGGKTLRYLLRHSDYPVSPLSNLWNDTSAPSNMRYVVETNTKVLQRCLLMSTDPGDIIFDPTCGSGTSAFVAEKWGRRCITCDTSRVAITLAKQRLMTSLFEYFALANENEGISKGFRYRTVPHITLKSIANNPQIKEGMSLAEIESAITENADQETLYDSPFVDNAKARVTGPFTVEAVPAINVRPLEVVTETRAMGRDSQTMLPGVSPTAQQDLPLAADVSVTRSGETIRQMEWRDELARSGVRGKSGQKIEFARLEPLAAARHLHAIGETRDKQPKTIAVSFGPEHAPLEQRQVEHAWEEARALLPRPAILLFAAFHFDPEAAKDIDELTPEKTGMLFLRAQMNTDLLTDDLKKKRASNEGFWLIGQPDVTLRQIRKGDRAGLWEVEVNGFDYYDPTSGKIESGDTRKIAMWLLDPDYDGRSLFPRQVFFPMAGEKDGWARLAKNLKAEIDEELIEAYRGTVSLPFALGARQRVAVKIVDDRGIESLKILVGDK